MKTSIRFILPVLLVLANINNLHSQWIQTNGPSSGYIYALHISDTILFAGTNDGIYRSLDHGGAWSQTGLPGTFIYSFTSNTAGIFAGTGGSGVYLSQNNGLNWTSAGLAPFNGYALATIGNHLFAGTAHGVYYTINNGASWTDPVELNNTIFTSFAVSDSNLYGGSFGPGVVLSANYSVSWQLISSGMINGTINAVSYSDTKLYAGSEGGGVFLTTNNGSNWNAINNGLSGSNVRTFAASGSNEFTGTDSGVFLSTNNGAVWNNVNNGLTNKDIRCLLISGTYIYAGTFGNGVWKRPLNEMITSVQILSNELPPDFMLEQNYPNPFNPVTVIRYQITENSFTTLKIYDLSGKEISTLVNEKQIAGYYSVSFNGADLPSGVYIYKLQSYRSSETKKMILIK